MPTPPPLNREQRLENLKFACYARKKRKHVKEQIAEGNVTIFEVIQYGKKDAIVGKLKPFEMITAIPGFGRAKAQGILDAIGISPKTTIKGLGKRQIAQLVDAIGFY